MKNIVVGGGVIIILSLSLILIICLLNPRIIKKEFETTSKKETLEYNVQYNVLEREKDYQKYQINQVDMFEIKVNDLFLKYDNFKLYINDELVKENIILYDQFAIYNNSRLLILYKEIDSFRSSILLYNSLDNTYEIISVLENMYLKVNENTLISSEGISIELTIVDNNKIILNNKENNVCNFGYDNTLIAIKGIEYLYDYNLKEFNRIEEVYSLPVESYIINNKICERN